MHPICDRCNEEPGHIAVVCIEGHIHRQCEYCAPITVAETLKALDVKESV